MGKLLGTESLPELKNDSYRRERGGKAKFLVLSCTACGARVMLYQKDGEGRLLRCYLNRIFDPPTLEELQRVYRDAKPSDVPALKCASCATLLGVPMLYRDGRLAYRLLDGAIAKSSP